MTGTGAGVNYGNSQGVRPLVYIDKTQTSVINYGVGKTASTVAEGDTIGITFDLESAEQYTELFMVLSNENNEIMAVPYYNITLDLDNPVQSPNAETSAFANEYYWNRVITNIDMNNTRNIVQQYIEAYSNKLSRVTEGVASAEIGRFINDETSSGWDIGGFSKTVNGKYLLNPTNTNGYWLGTSDTGSKDYVKVVVKNRLSTAGPGRDQDTTSPAYKLGVRPIIKLRLD